MMANVCIIDEPCPISGYEVLCECLREGDFTTIVIKQPIEFPVGGGIKFYHDVVVNYDDRPYFAKPNKRRGIFTSPHFSDSFVKNRKSK